MAGVAADADLVIVAVPVGHVAELVVEALDAGAPVVTDVGSVKAPVVDAVEAARPDAGGRFVGGHPMAGSEQDGVDGADPDLFVGATWVLTPTANGPTRPRTRTVRRVVAPLGAEVVDGDARRTTTARRGGQPRAPARGVDADGRRDANGKPSRPPCCGSPPAGSAT